MLDQYSETELLQELARRKKQNKIKLPKALLSPNFVTLMVLAEEHIKNIKEGMSDDRYSDAKEYIYEAVMEAVYGKDIWQWILEVSK